MATALSRIERLPLVPECRIAIAGFGTVGNAVAQLLESGRDNHSLRLTHVCNRNVARKKVSWLARDVVWTEDLQQMLNSDADVIVELMGGLEPAHRLVREALRSGKSVVTANKQLIARFGTELLQLANDNGQYLGFGACVAGGIPVLSALQDGLVGDRLIQLRGILNGTCNYILTRIELVRHFILASSRRSAAGWICRSRSDRRPRRPRRGRQAGDPGACGTEDRCAARAGHLPLDSQCRRHRLRIRTRTRLHDPPDINRSALRGASTSRRAAFSRAADFSFCERRRQPEYCGQHRRVWR